MREYEPLVEQFVTHLLAHDFATVNTVVTDSGNVVERVVVVPVGEVPSEYPRNREPVCHGSLVNPYPELCAVQFEIDPYVLVQYVESVYLVVTARRRISDNLHLHLPQSSFENMMHPINSSTPMKVSVGIISSPCCTCCR